MLEAGAMAVERSGAGDRERTRTPASSARSWRNAGFLMS